MSYYNTTNIDGAELADSRGKARKQDDIVLECFGKFPNGATPSDIHSFAFAHAAPITSIRRAISNLTDAGLLVKTQYKRLGPYGKPEYIWKLPPAQLELF